MKRKDEKDNFQYAFFGVIAKCLILLLNTKLSFFSSVPNLFSNLFSLLNIFSLFAIKIRKMPCLVSLSIL